MKTSIIIFISLLSAIAILIVMAAVDIKLSIRKGKELPNNYISTKVVLPDYKILDIRDSRSIELVQGDSAYIALSVMKDSLPPELKYQIKGDTLFLADRMMSGGKSYTVKIHANKLLQEIYVMNTTLNLNNFKESYLSISLDNSKINCYQFDVIEKTFSRLVLFAKNQSSFYFSNTKIDSLSLNLQKSGATFMTDLSSISGSLADSSRLELQQFDQISLKKDPSSTITIYN
jgi:hypothetical protein